mmetsp:Transcript_50239/g.86022  ORF Transcript_50239/g.86022 Transcript_50239/m.86022 type:complete len:253 (-) Transcript_50239:852-1610(-)
MRSPQPKALRLMDGAPQLFVELLEGSILRNQQVVKARVAGGEAVAVGPHARDDEREAREAVDGRAVAARGKLQKEPFLVVVKRVQRLPKEANGLAALVEAVVVFGRPLQRFEVQHGVAAHQKLQLFGLEHLQRLPAAHLHEPAGKSVELRLDAVHQHPLHVPRHVLPHVGVGHWNIAASGHQLVRLPLPPLLHRHLKRRAERGCDVPLKRQHVPQALAQPRVHFAQVLNGQRRLLRHSPLEPLVNHHGEWDV